MDDTDDGDDRSEKLLEDEMEPEDIEEESNGSGKLDGAADPEGYCHRMWVPFPVAEGDTRTVVFWSASAFALLRVNMSVPVLMM